jgi:ElaA protein
MAVSWQRLIDGKDIQCLHLYLEHEGEIAAYARLLPPGLSFEEASIGRVIVNQSFRREGLGKQLMKIAIEVAKQEWPEFSIRIPAQSYLQEFYSDLGFEKITEEYIYDNLPHIDMILK